MLRSRGSGARRLGSRSDPSSLYTGLERSPYAFPSTNRYSARTIASLTALYIVTNMPGTEYYVAGGYALSIGMATGIAVLLVLGRATPYRRMRKRAVAGPTMPGGPTSPADLSAQPAAKK